MELQPCVPLVNKGHQETTEGFQENICILILIILVLVFVLIKGNMKSENLT